MKKLAELRSQQDALKTEILALKDRDDLSDEEEARFDAAMTEFETVTADVKAAEERAAKLDVIERTAHAEPGSDPGSDPKGVNQINRGNPFEGEVRGIARKELRHRAREAAELRGKRLNTEQQKDIESKLERHDHNFDGDYVAERILVTESDAYRSAFLKWSRQALPASYTHDEAIALERFTELRAMNEGTLSAGGYGIPVFIDPTIIISSAAAAAPIVEISTLTPITTNQWKGVTGASATWQATAEAAVVTDDSITLLQPTIPAYKTSTFIPFSVEVGDDYPGFEAEMSKVMADGYIDYLAKKSALGVGSTEPTGIFTGMQNNTTNPAHYIVKTLGQLGAVDARGAWAQLPERFRPNATWVMHVSVENQVIAWSGQSGAGSALALADFTVNMTAAGVPLLRGRPVVKSDYAPNPTNTTGPESFLVVGDFSHYRIVQRVGMDVELVPMLFDQATGRPTLQRGWVAWARVGMDADTYRAFVLCSNT